MSANKNVLKPGYGDVVVASKLLDIVLGCFWMTKSVTGVKGEGNAFPTTNAAITAYDFGAIDYSREDQGLAERQQEIRAVRRQGLRDHRRPPPLQFRSSERFPVHQRRDHQQAHGRARRRPRHPALRARRLSQRSSTTSSISVSAMLHMRASRGPSPTSSFPRSRKKCSKQGAKCSREGTRELRERTSDRRRAPPRDDRDLGKDQRATCANTLFQVARSERSGPRHDHLRRPRFGRSITQMAGMKGLIPARRRGHRIPDLHPLKKVSHLSNTSSRRTALVKVSPIPRSTLRAPAT